MDLVVTVPKPLWLTWLAEGDLPGEAPGGVFGLAAEYDFSTAAKPPIAPGERLYVVAHGHVRGYAPVTRVHQHPDGRWSIARRAGAVACTVVDSEFGPRPVSGFRGFRERWWPRVLEEPFPAWRTHGVEERCRNHGRVAGVLWIALPPLETYALCASCAANLPERAARAGATYRVLADLRLPAAAVGLR